MRDISSYITNKIRGHESSRILLFDVDDTLIHTSAQIGIIKNDKIVNRIPNAEFNDYVLKPGEDFDFSEFNDADILNNDLPTKYLDTLKREYARGTHIGIITARSDAKLIKDFLQNKGIDIKTELVFAINDPKFHLTGSIQQKKATIIKRLAQAGYKTLVFFDDNEGNLEAAKKLQKGDIKIVTVKV